MRKIMIMLAAATGLAGCDARVSQESANDSAGSIATVDEDVASYNAPAADPAADPDAPQRPPSLPEPKGPIDPVSSEAAGQVVQHYGALIEQGKFADAAKYWSDQQEAAAFARQLRAYRDVHLNIGDLGEQEGAAGSIYITEPVTFYGKTKSGENYSRSAVVTLRRVNDVPGSTPEQRRWHIQSIAWS